MEAVGAGESRRAVVRVAARAVVPVAGSKMTGVEKLEVCVRLRELESIRRC